MSEEWPTSKARVDSPQAAIDLEIMAASVLDVLVVGGGITGACIALEATRRGLSVGLVERGDYGGGATANCLKIVHGGLRYLQHLDVRRARASAVERSVWLRSAPHLVEPLPVLLPTYRGQFPPRAALAAALAINEALSWDRNRGLLPEREIRPARMLSRREAVALEPSLDAAGLSGGVLFYDALMYSPERLTLEVVEAARAAGAVTANHVEFVAPVQANGRIARARLRDVLDGHVAEVRTRWIVNATGSSVPALAARFAPQPASKPQAYSVALSFVTRQPARRVAFTVSVGTADQGRGRTRQLFIVPWRGQTMIGTAHLAYRGDPAAFQPAPEHIERFTEEIATARPAIPFANEEIALVHAGLLPIANAARGRNLRLLDRHRIIDHAAEGCPGALSVITVKFTTARQVARDILDRIVPEGSPQTAARTMPLPGGVFHSLEQLRSGAKDRYGALLPADVLEHLVRTYGARYEDVFEYRRHLTAWDQRVVPDAPVIRAQLVHGVLAEHARSAADLLWRRTEIGPRGLVTDAALRMAEEAMAGIRPHDPNPSIVV